MRLLNRDTDYAVRALTYLATQPGRVVSSREIARTQRVSLLFTRRILQVLKQRRVLGAREGARGGVWLSLKPAEIFLADVMRMFQKDIHFSACLFQRAVCHNRATCPLRKRIGAIESRVLDELSRVSIADLVADIRRNRS